MQVRETDIVIIGAGISGCILALALAPYYAVTLVDNAATPPNRLGGSLPPGAMRVLDRLGLLDILDIKSAGQHIVNQKTTSYWGNDSPQLVECFNANVVDARAFEGRAGAASDTTWHINRRCFENRLRETAVAMGVECCWPVNIGQTDYADAHWHVDVLPGVSTEKNERNQNHSSQPIVKSTMETARQYRARFVVDASGRESNFAMKQGAHRIQTDKLITVEMMFDNTEPSASSSIHPTQEGWWYCSPFPNANGLSRSGAGLLSFQTDADLFDETQRSAISYWIDKAKNTPSMANIMQQIDLNSLSHFAVQRADSSRLAGQTGSRWLAVGEAAMSLDPLSVQDMFHVMAGSMYLRDLLVRYGIESDMSCHCIAFELHRQLERTWVHYRSCQQYYYAQETRWSASPFWKRRAA